jgi:hypothetical protein
LELSIIIFGFIKLVSKQYRTGCIIGSECIDAQTGVAGSILVAKAFDFWFQQVAG